MLLVLLSIGLILQSIQPNYEWMQYSIGVLALTNLFQIAMALLRRYGKSAEGRAESAAKNLEALYSREERLAKERSEKYREDNKIRDERLIKLLEKIDGDGNKFVQALSTTTERFAEITTEDRKNFVELINKVMDQSSYQTGELTALKTIVEKLPDEFESLKKDINQKLDNITLHYQLHSKEEQ